MAACFLALGACRQDMQDQPRFKTLGHTKFFPDGRMARPLAAGTVPRGALNSDVAFYEGKVNGQPIDYFPIPVDQALMERGRDRFDIYCSPCHGRVGNGLGMIVRRGLKQPPSYHIDRLRTAPVGYFFDVVTNGYGAMLNYAAQIQPRDRWAIIAYIRALQYSQNANVNELPADVRANIPASSTLVTPGEQVPPRRERDVTSPEKEMIPKNKPVPSTRPGGE
jgi:mono/diheme cytochrome c family protein